MHKSLVLAVIAVAPLSGYWATPVLFDPSSDQIRLLNDPGINTLQARFGSVPPNGAHPRILLSASDVTTLQQRLQSTAVGRYVVARLESYLDAFHGQGKPLADVYRRLLSGDNTALNYAANDSWKASVPFALSMECYDAMMRQDADRGKRAGTALATLAQIITNWSANDSDLMNFALRRDRKSARSYLQ